MVIGTYGPNSGTIFDFDEDILPPSLRACVVPNERSWRCRNRPMKKTRAWYTRAADSPNAPEAVARAGFARGPKKRRRHPRPGNFSRSYDRIAIRPTAHVYVPGSALLRKPRIGAWAANSGEDIPRGRGAYSCRMGGLQVSPEAPKQESSGSTTSFGAGGLPSQRIERLSFQDRQLRCARCRECLFSRSAGMGLRKTAWSVGRCFTGPTDSFGNTGMRCRLSLPNGQIQSGRLDWNANLGMAGE